MGLRSAERCALLLGMENTLTALERAKEVAGGAAGLSRKLNNAITPQAISQWRKVPAERAMAVSEATGVPLHELRPDVFPAPPKQEMAS